MKMISSTSTTSTSGVMLISECRLEPEPSLNCMITASFLLGFGALGDQADPLEAGLLDGDHGLPDFAEMEPCVAFDHDLGVRSVAHRGVEAFAEMLGRHRLIVDPQDRKSTRLNSSHLGIS